MKRLLLLLVTILLLLSCQSKRKHVLYIFNWTDYISRDLIKSFEEKHDCKVIYDTYNSNENMLTRILNSRKSYDIVVPSGDHVSIMLNKKLLEELDKSKLKNYKNLDPKILHKAKTFDPDNKFSIPYFWGTAGLVYNKKHISDEFMKNPSWHMLSHEQFLGKDVITMLDDPREVIGSALVCLGFDANDTSDEALLKARELLLKWDKNITQYDSDSFKNEIQDGTTWIAHSYNGDALQIMEENSEIGFVLPVEGSTLWIDSMVILKNAENKDMAYEFIDFILEAQNAKENAIYVSYATPNIEAFKLLPAEISENDFIYPPDDYVNRCSSIRDIGEEILKVDEIWEEIRAN
ncbi:MAG: spermidine/putrescine ABC transporter substrate-binding protein [Candidatus Cloacimonetes bacterium]|nr:spermidine/putrescine ABC transporter substrate-binding protein [Candidatus Cloacimonadota bacterium]